MAAVVVGIGLTAMVGCVPPGETNQLTPIGVRSLEIPDPVVAADGFTHLAYELLVFNQGSVPVTLRSITALDGADRRALGAPVSGAHLLRIMRVGGGQDGPVIRPGQQAYLFMDVIITDSNRVPTRLAHTITLSFGHPVTQQTITGIPVAVHTQPAVVVAPPLRGSGWIVGNGCCDPPTVHRTATLSIDGTVHVPERFAIDFVQLNGRGQLFTGDPQNPKNTDFGYFGTGVCSATNGTVVHVQDGLPEQTPGALDPNATVLTAGGNYIVVNMGGGRYAFYAPPPAG